MKILLDENLPIKLKYKLVPFEVYSVHDMSWKGVKNGKLLELAVSNNFSVFVTSDKNLRFQQNIQKIGLTILILNVKLLKWNFIEPMIPNIIKSLHNVIENSIIIIE